MTKIIGVTDMLIVEMNGWRLSTTYKEFPKTGIYSLASLALLGTFCAGAFPIIEKLTTCNRVSKALKVCFEHFQMLFYLKAMM